MCLRCARSAVVSAVRMWSLCSYYQATENGQLPISPLSEVANLTALRSPNHHHDYGGAEAALTAARLSSYLSFSMLSGTRPRLGP